MTLRASFLSLIGWAVLSLWNRTVRITYVHQDIPLRLRQEGKNFIYAFWHGRQFLLLANHCGQNVVIPASESRDGEIQAGILKRFGYHVVRGSSKRKGERALLGLVDGLRKGLSPALAVDGPRGPLYEVKQGVAYLAGKLDKVIIPVASSARRYWVLEKLWDKYLLPRPFTRGVIMYGPPIIVRGIAPGELEARRLELQEALTRVTAEADAYFGKEQKAKGGK